MNPGSTVVECRRFYVADRGSQDGKFDAKVGITVAETGKTLASVAQLMNRDPVLLGQKYGVQRVGRGRLRMVAFRLRKSPVQWAKLAPEKHQAVPFRDVHSPRYVAVSVDAEVRRYGKSF